MARQKDPSPARHGDLNEPHSRVGSYREALETLRHADQLNGGDPTVAASLAMAYHHLGQEENAHSALIRLRLLMEEPAHADDATAQGFLSQAESLITPEPAAGREEQGSPD